MEEIVKALEKLLERGIVVETGLYGDNDGSYWAGTRGPRMRIRLANDPEQPTKDPGPIPAETPRGGLTW